MRGGKQARPIQKVRAPEFALEALRGPTKLSPSLCQCSSLAGGTYQALLALQAASNLQHGMKKAVRCTSYSGYPNHSKQQAVRSAKINLLGIDRGTMFHRMISPDLPIIV